LETGSRTRQNCLVLSALVFILPTRTRQDKSVLFCLCRRCEEAIVELRSVSYYSLTTVYCTTGSMYSCFNVLFCVHHALSQFYFPACFASYVSICLYFISLQCIVGLVILFFHFYPLGYQLCQWFLGVGGPTHSQVWCGGRPIILFVFVFR